MSDTNLSKKELIKKINELEKEITLLKSESDLLNSQGELIAWGTNTAVWNWDYASGVVKFSAKKAQMLGYNPEELNPDVYSFTSMIHPDDYENTMQIMRDHLRGELPVYEVEYRIMDKDGSWKWFFDKGKVIKRDRNGQPVTIVGIVNDITLRKKAELENRKLLKAIECSRVSIIITDFDGKIEYVNHYFSELTGYSREECYGKNPNLLRSDYHKKDYYDNLWKTIKAGITWEGEFQNQKKNGDLYWESAIISPLIDEKGKITHFVGVKVNITDQKEATIRLEESETSLKLALQIARMGYWRYEVSSERVEWSKGHEKLFGISLEKFGGTLDAVQRMVHPEDRDAGKANFTNAIIKKSSFDHHYRVIHPDKSIHWLHSLGKILVNEKNEPEYVFGVTQDITQQKEAEANLKLKSLVLEQIRDHVTITDLNGFITYVNKRQEELLGYKADDQLGKPTIIYGEDSKYGATQKEILQNTLEHGFWQGEIMNYSKDGTPHLMECKTQIIHDENLKPVALFGISSDITERKKAEHDLIIAKERAEESDRLKTAFIQNLSHEIRTPLNAIMGFSELLLGKPSNLEKVKKYSELIYSKGKELLAIISDILEISRIESGNMSVYCSKFNVVSLFIELKESFESYLKSGNVDMVFNSKGDLWISSDYEKLFKILNNLIDNALKNTNIGVVQVGVEQSEDQLTFFVTDTGIGIPEDKFDLIFQRFFQILPPPQGISRGTGLGLSIVQGLVELLGGTVIVKSSMGEGSQFSFTIPHRIPDNIKL